MQSVDYSPKSGYEYYDFTIVPKVKYLFEFPTQLIC